MVSFILILRGEIKIMPILCLDPGHNSPPNADTGCRGFGINEEDIVIDVCKRAKSLIEFNGIKTILTREGDCVPGGNASLYDSLNTRCNIANNANADLFISVHCNAFNTQAYGTEVYIYGTGGNAEHLAKIIQPKMSQLFYNRGIKLSNFQVLRDTNMPAILIETAFLDNQQDNAKLVQPEIRQQIAVIIAKSVCQFFGITYREQSQQPSPISIPVEEKYEIPTGDNITRLNGGYGWIESLPDQKRVIIHANKSTYLSIEDGSIYAYVKGKNAIKLI